ncbi:MAG: PAS domain S-box protein [Candidatus Zixiibacteriota bacterium]
MKKACEDRPIQLKSTDGFLLLDSQGRLLQVNESYCRLSGYSEQELLRMNISDLEAIGEPIGKNAGILGLLERGGGRCQSQHRSKNGTQYETEISAWRRPEHGGRHEVYVRSIFGYQPAEQGEQQRQTDFRAFFEKMDDMTFVTSLTGHILFTNKAAERKLEYGESELRGKHVLELHPPEVREEVAAILEAMIAGKRRHCTLQMVSKLGNLIPVEIRVFFGRWNDADCLFGICKDLSAEQDARQRFERLFRNNPALMAVSVMPTRTLVDVNDTFLKTMGYTREEVIGRTTEELKLFVDSKHLDVLAHVMHHEGRFAEVELQVRRRDGAILDGLFSGEIVNTHGQQYFLTVMLDITERKEMESRLRAQGEKYQGIFDESVAAIYIFDEKKRFIDSNQAGLDLLGYSREELLTKSIPDVDANPVVVLPAHQQLLGGDRIINYEHQVVRKDGKVITVLNNSRPLTNSDGTVIGMQSTLIDVTERKRAEEALRESREVLHAVLNSIPVRVFWKDRDSVYLGCNNAFARDAGHEKVEDIIGKNDRDLGWREQADQYRADDRAVIEGGEVHLLFEEPQTTPSGDQIHLLTSKVPLRDGAGEIVGVLGVYQDITDRKRAEKALELRESYLRSIIENQPGLVWLKDKDGRFQDVNQAFALACGRGNPRNLIGLSDLDVWPKELAEKYRRDDTEVMQTGAGKIVEELVQDQGKVTWFETFKTPVIGENGEIIGTTGYARDITETKRLRELESRAQRLETAGQIAGQVAHDFNNMLAPMMAYPELIREQLPEGNLGFDYLAAIEDSARKIAEMNQQLLTLSRRGHYSQDVVSLNVIIQHALRDMAPWPDSLIIEAVLSPDLMNIRGGAAQLHRVILNLVTNARDAMQDIGRMTITTENFYADATSVTYGRIPRGEYVKVTVSDTGSGIPEGVIQTIFDPFFTTKSTNKTRGSGLGLSIVDAVVKDHGGYIDLSTKVGGGTSFYLYFPITRALMCDKTSDETPHGVETILVVDDDATQREVSTRILASLGYQVEACEGGRKALSILAHKQIELLVLDMIMPNDLDGTETYRRALEIRADQKAIIVSGFSESDRVVEARRLGARTFVRKPFDRKIIALAVRQELDRQVCASA